MRSCVNNNLVQEIFIPLAIALMTGKNQELHAENMFSLTIMSTVQTII